MANTFRGKIYQIDELRIVNEQFRSRNFVIHQEYTNEIGQTFTNYARFQAINQSADILDTLGVGLAIEVTYNIKGNLVVKDGEERVYTNLNAYKIEVVGQQAQQQPQSRYQDGKEYTPEPKQNSNFPPPQDDDLPF